MFRMCIKLSESKYNSIEEINELYNCKELNLSYMDLENMKDDRELIEEKLDLAEQFNIIYTIEGL